MTTNPTLAEALRQPQKCPSANTQVDTQSPITSISESEFNNGPENELEVSLEDVYDHLDMGAAPEGFVDVNGALEGAPVAAEDEEQLDGKSGGLRARQVHLPHPQLGEGEGDI